jgi:hypothetical protein
MTNVNRWTGISLAVGLAVYVVKLHVLGHQPHRSILQTPRANMTRKRPRDIGPLKTWDDAFIDQPKADYVDDHV